MSKMTDDEMYEYTNAQNSYICSKTFDSSRKDLKKVMDHDHLNIKYRGPACNTCNQNYKLLHYVNVIAHNLFGYDIHLSFEELCMKNDDIKVFANSLEKIKFLDVTMTRYMIKHKDYKFSLRFIDSLNFLSGSLDKIASTLRKNQFRNIKNFFKIAEYQDIITRKLPFPYKF